VAPLGWEHIGLTGDYVHRRTAGGRLAPTVAATAVAIGSMSSHIVREGAANN